MLQERVNLLGECVAEALRGALEVERAEISQEREVEASVGALSVSREDGRGEPHGDLRARKQNTAAFCCCCCCCCCFERERERARPAVDESANS